MGGVAFAAGHSNRDGLAKEAERLRALQDSSTLLSELSEDWRRALVTWLVEAYDNKCSIEDFEGIHKPGAREQIQGARLW